MAAIAQLGERQTEDLKVPGSIPGLGILLSQMSCCLSGTVLCLCEHGANRSDVPRNAAMDTLAEWLRRRPAKPMGSPRVGSNPTGVVCMNR